MRHAEFPSQICSIARSLEILGEWWTLLVVREAFFGARRFGEFEANLGIARNVLSDRLSKLVEAGVLDREPEPGRGNPVAYRLTEKGRELLPVLVALMQWGDRWINSGREPVTLVERETGKEIAPLEVASREGRPLRARDLVVTPGPGADAVVERRFGGGKTE
ncbi:helix-turn-helix domain-containing protein [Methylosinus sp. Sm6]|uniref:winged helix-turn-helix transcriptional regulator n=1 Tax=Methylosinus sp. Sm6 TaxID=2866948 RepID=UPI001C98FD0B|nr:helix-turn-helix domain-containing protein [Methylosinus sp. Sm6]MBY6242768.1 helix-turn-helix transcriptional regulator [Methylosinus sp. Sm6]